MRHKNVRGLKIILYLFNAPIFLRFDPEPAKHILCLLLGSQVLLDTTLCALHEIDNSHVVRLFIIFAVNVDDGSVEKIRKLGKILSLAHIVDGRAVPNFTLVH